MRCLLVAFTVAALGASVAGAVSLDRPRLELRRSDEADAASALLRSDDLDPSFVWSGGRVAPDLSPPPSCEHFKPKQSDLVVTGAAASDFRHAGADIESQVEVLRTAQMVDLDWKRVASSARFLPCLRQVGRTVTPSSLSIKSIDRFNFPWIAGARHTAAIRAVMGAHTANGEVLVAVDTVWLAWGRDEIALTVTTPLADESTGDEVSLAYTLLDRVWARSGKFTGG